jgi:hypothetical protein
VLPPWPTRLPSSRGVGGPEVTAYEPADHDNRRPGTRRALLGRNDRHRRLKTPMDSRATRAPVGQVTARAPYPMTRRGTPWQDRSPCNLWPIATAVTAAPSLGLRPAHPRHAISTREHHKGGAPTRSAADASRPPAPLTARTTSTRALTAPLHDHPPAGGAPRAPTASRRDRLRRHDPPTRPRFRQRSRQGDWPTPKTSRKPTHKHRHTTAMSSSHSTGPFHIRLADGYQTARALESP